MLLNGTPPCPTPLPPTGNLPRYELRPVAAPRGSAPWLRRMAARVPNGLVATEMVVAGGMGTGRPQHRSQLLLCSPVRPQGRRVGRTRSELRLLESSRTQHRAPPLLHSPPFPQMVADPPVGAVLREMGAELAPHSLVVPPLHRSNNGPILKNGSQGVDVSPRASRQRYNPTGPERSPAALRM
jgi:hypothetical protein